MVSFRDRADAGLAAHWFATHLGGGPVEWDGDPVR